MQDESIKTPPGDIGSKPPVTPAPQNLPLPNDPHIPPPPDGPAGDAAASPAWARDLRQLYNIVVEEPLPDSFIDLLAQLDSKD